MSHPATGDLVRVRITGRPRSPYVGAVRTGRVKQREGITLSVRFIGDQRNTRVSLQHVQGWWPKGAKNRSGKAMRRIEEPA